MNGRARGGAFDLHHAGGAELEAHCCHIQKSRHTRIEPARCFAATAPARRWRRKRDPIASIIASTDHGRVEQRMTPWMLGGRALPDTGKSSGLRTKVTTFRAPSRGRLRRARHAENARGDAPFRVSRNDCSTAVRQSSSVRSETHRVHSGRDLKSFSTTNGAVRTFDPRANRCSSYAVVEEASSNR